MSELVPVDEKLFARILHCPSCGHEYHEQLSNIALDESTDSESPKRRRMTDPASLVCPKCNVTINEEKSDDVNTRMEAGMVGPLSGDHHTTKASQEDICGNRPREAKPEKPNKMHEDDGGLIIDVENVTPSPPDRLIIANSPTADSKNSIPSEASNGSTVHVKAEVKKEASLSTDSLRDAKPSVNDKHNIPPGPCPDELQHPNDTTVEKEIKLEDDKPSPPDLLSILRNRELWSPISDDEISPVTPLSSLPPFNVQNPALGIAPPGITNNSMGNMTPPFPNLSVPPPPLAGIANFCPPVFANTPMNNMTSSSVSPNIHVPQGAFTGPGIIPGTPQMDVPANIHGPQAAVARPAEVSGATQMDVPANIYGHQGVVARSGTVPAAPQRNVSPKVHGLQGAVGKPVVVPGTPQMNVPSNIHAPQGAVVRPGVVPGTPQMNMQASAPVRANPSPQSTITGSNTRTCVKNTATSPSAPQPLPKPLPKRPIVTRPAATASAPTHGHAPPPNANLSAPEYQCQQLTGAPVMNALEKPLFAMCIKCNTEFYELKPMDFKLLFPAESIQTSSNLADLVQGNQNTATIRRTVPSGRRSTKNIGTSGNNAK
ncbi:hypothetical protein NECAME_00670 [Necator americanus]|uniref:Uncharacterized protein n=1 Tax=Necator americanus TaxID=51031 RepID=W2T145_NECAM|nr:hypothetical protein NECAME_00670 [Necator americanus]ETN75259.1 hypothetical protein NECAME_00670 [Necator americanus]